ncbi:FAD-dependent oxidoreductase [Pararhizobium sp. LjRoot235]
MKSHARVVVIGGGVVGCSILYHLTKFGWADVVLVERSELTSGSTWHAAGGMHTINGDPNVAKLQKYTVELYKEIQDYSGQDIGLHMTSGMMLAATKERFDWMKSIMAKGRYMGLEAELLSPREAHDLMPLLDPSQFVGAEFDPVEGHLDPYGTTHAYAKSARKNGADIYLHTKVEDLVQLENGTWRVITNKGEIIAEHVVNAAGLWAREVGRMTGLELPVKKEADFIGKEAAAKEKAEGGTLRLRTFVIDAMDADVIGDEPISLNGKVCGWVTSGGYAHTSGVSVAIGYVPKDVADEAYGWQVELLGEMLPARLQAQPLLDANGSRMRS